MSSERPAAWDYDYERMLDLAARIAGNGDQIDLSDRTAEGNKKAVALAGQIVADGIELRELLHARQSAIEGRTMTAASRYESCSPGRTSELSTPGIHKSPANGETHAPGKNRTCAPCMPKKCL